MQIKLFLLRSIFLSCLLGVCLSFGGCVNRASRNFELSKKYHEESAVFTEKSRAFKIRIHKDSIRIHSKVKSSMLHLKEGSGELANQRVRYTQFIKVNNIRAYSLVPKKIGNKKIKIKSYGDREVRSESIFYDDLREKYVLFPGISSFTETVLQHKEELIEPHLLNPYFFSSYVPVVRSEFSWKVPSKVRVTPRFFNTTNDSIDIKSKKGLFGGVKYTCVFHNVPSYHLEENSEGLRYTEPHISLQIHSYRSSKKEVKVLDSVEDLYKWYYHFAEHTDTLFIDSFRSLADSISGNTITDIDKAKRIFRWVQKNITYLAIEDGVNGFRPQHPEVVLKRKFGDCKDMASLLVHLLRAEGISAYLSWVGTRVLPYTFMELPTPSSNDHMIVCIEADGLRFFIDPTGKWQPFHLPSSFILGKEVLVGKTKEYFEIGLIPIPSSEESKSVIHNQMRIDQDQLIVRGYMEASGYTREKWSREWDGLDDVNLPQHLKDVLLREGKIVEVESYSLHHIDDLDRNMSLHYVLNIKKHHKPLHNELYINMHIQNHPRNEVPDTIRSSPFTIPFPTMRVIENELLIPTGYKIAYVPEDCEVVYPKFGFKIHFEIKSNSVVMRHEWWDNFIHLNAEELKLYGKMIDKELEERRKTLLLSLDPISKEN